MSSVKEVNDPAWTPWLDEAEAFAEDMPGAWSDGQKRQFATQVVPAYRRHIEQQQRRGYEPVAERAAKEFSMFTTAAEELGEVAEAIGEDLEAGEITAAQARRQLAVVVRDLRRCRSEGVTVRESERKAWERVNLSPAQYQRQVAERFPALFQGGRGLPHINDRVIDGRERLKFD